MILGYGASYVAIRAASGTVSGKSLPPLHVGLDVEQILEANTPWFPRGGFQHEAAKLGMKDRGSGLDLPDEVSRVRSHDSRRCSLDWASLHIGHSASFVEQLLVRGQGS